MYYIPPAPLLHNHAALLDVKSTLLSVRRSEMFAGNSQHRSTTDPHRPRNRQRWAASAATSPQHGHNMSSSSSGNCYHTVTWRRKEGHEGGIMLGDKRQRYHGSASSVNLFPCSCQACFSIYCTCLARSPTRVIGDVNHAVVSGGVNPVILVYCKGDGSQRPGDSG